MSLQDNKIIPEEEYHKEEEQGFNDQSLSLRSRLKGLPPNDSKRFYFLSLLLLIFSLLAMFNKQILSYASCFLGAFTLFAVLRGPMRKLTLRYKWKKAWAAGFLTLAAIFFFLIPLGGVVAMLVDLFSNTKFDLAIVWDEARRWNGIIYERFNVNVLTFETVKNLTSFGQQILSWFFSNISSMTINSVLMVFVLFYMLLERSAFETAIRELLPFTNENKKILITESKRIIVANAISIPVLAIIQGLFAYGGYLFLGVPNPLFFAVLTAFATIIPIVGTMIVYLPLALYFAIGGEWISALILFLYGFLIIGGVDNVARLLLQKWLADIHPLITVFGVFFGMAIFGFWGVIFGPLLLSLLILFINMYRHDYVPGSLAKPRVTTPVKESKSGISERINTVREKLKRELLEKEDEKEETSES